MASTNRPRRNLPFLHRNWVAAMNSWQAMGNGTTSSALSGSNDRFAGSREDDHYPRAAKRRRLAVDQPLDAADAMPLQNGNVNGHADGHADGHANGLANGLANGNGTDTSTTGLGHSLPEQPGETQRALRIEIFKIIHKDTARVKYNPIFNGNTPPAVKDITSSKARCKLMIFTKKGGMPVLLYCDNQICDIKAFKNPVGPHKMARVCMPQPFTIPQDKISVMREDDGTLDIADTYSVHLQLESASSLTWPPLDTLLAPDEAMAARSNIPPRFWVLSAQVTELFGRPKSRIPLQLETSRDASPVTTVFVMDVDVRWTTGYSHRFVAKRLDKDDIQPSIMAVGLDDNGVPLVNGHTNGDVNGATMTIDEEDDDSDVAEGELTPTRSLRLRARRGQPEYNLKSLTYKAHGKLLRGRKKLDKDDRLPEDEPRVTYILPPEQLALEGFVCCICRATTLTLAQLRTHFLCHPQYHFDLDQRPGRGGNVFSISHAAEGPVSPLRPKVYQLGRPTKPLDLDKYLAGDDSWVTSRYGPDNDERPTQAAAKQPPQKRGGRRKGGKVLVPNTKQPLYDSLSKAQLEPGTEVRRNLADDTWLIHKHREVVQDYSDLSHMEKEYIKEWDSFIIGERISSEAYIGRAFIQFAAEKGDWLVAEQPRMGEFGKHLSVLVARGVLDDATVQRALSHISEARARLKEAEARGALPPAPVAAPKEPVYKSVKGCAVCGLPVLGPSLLVCTNKDCKKRLYHDDCIAATAKVPVDSFEWFCNECAPAAGTGQ